MRKLEQAGAAFTVEGANINTADATIIAQNNTKDFLNMRKLLKYDFTNGSDTITEYAGLGLGIFPLHFKDT